MLNTQNNLSFPTNDLYLAFLFSSSLSQCCRNWPVRVYANDNAKNSSTGVPLYLSYIFKIIHKFHGNNPKDHQQEC